MDSVEFFGSNAGKVWNSLKEGAKTMTQIQKSTGLTVKDVCMGLGWLAKEGKIEALGLNEGLYLKFKLLE